MIERLCGGTEFWPRFWWGVRYPCNTRNYLLAWQRLLVHASVPIKVITHANFGGGLSPPGAVR
jgi:hypothetical protein